MPLRHLVRSAARGTRGLTAVPAPRLDVVLAEDVPGGSSMRIPATEVRVLRDRIVIRPFPDRGAQLCYTRRPDGSWDIPAWRGGVRLSLEYRG